MLCDDAVFDSVMRALEEDVGSGDVTTSSVVPEQARAEAHVVAKESGILCGLKAAELVFRVVDEHLLFESLAGDGDTVPSGMLVARVKGSARSILTAERTALNFLQHLSGIASLTAAVAATIEGGRTAILDTRKTVPGMRYLEKYAVRCGGGRNHRIGLFDGILIKNNHLKFVSIRDAIRRARSNGCALFKVEVEVETLEQLHDALDEGAEIIMLDNMSTEMIGKALKIIDGRALVEVSGKASPESVSILSRMGVDFISMGALTHSAKALDLSLRVCQA